MDYKILVEGIKDDHSFWVSVHQISLDVQGTLNSNYRKKNGIYYTHVDIAKYMVSELFELNEGLIHDVENKVFLEPCVGIGVFVFAFLDYCSQYIKNEKMKYLINNIYVADVDKNALDIYKCLLKKYALYKLNYVLSDSYFATHTCSGLLYSLSQNHPDYISLEDGFPYLKKKADIIITNPPYRNLKAEKNKYKVDEEYISDKYLFKNIASQSKHLFKSNKGVLNIYKLFVEEIVERYSAEKAVLSLLIPTTIFNDKTCEELRTLLFEKNQLLSINSISENNSYFDGSQALSSVLVFKGEPTTNFRVCSNFDPSTKVNYEYQDYVTTSLSKGTNSILFVNKSDKSLLNLLDSFPKLSSLPFIINARGELDLTAHKTYIQSNESQFKLLRGRDINFYRIRSNSDYVHESFVDISSKRQYILKPRIACQQISNISKERRLTFAYIPENYVLGNSCNFIFVQENEYKIDLFYLLGLLNSSLLNWYFKLNSSNNHVNNYDLANLPVAIGPSVLISKLSDLVKMHLYKIGDKDVLEQIDNVVGELYMITDIRPRINKSRKSNNDLINNFILDFKQMTGLTISTVEAEKIVIQKIDYTSILLITSLKKDDFVEKSVNALVEKYKNLYHYKLLNHTGFKLSSLDMEMVKCVPQGGNWKNIDANIIQKSKRLIRITETGGRTTLYGRIDYDKPSYTITTYFNRPGNGTYIHPIHNRVISVREAARFQSFPDDYYFFGNKNDLLKQIGNAVPPLMAYEIANEIIKHINIKTSVDLFVGAGGMTLGFKQAGIKSLIGVDFDKSACITLKSNNPEINVMLGDLTTEKTKSMIQEYTQNQEVDLVCGGPPCQGFSLAGKRFIDDPRNKLFKEYVDVLNRIKPKVFVMENVEGIKTMQNGLVYQEILQSFEQEGYSVAGNTLLATDFGVPQKRKRVIIIGVRKDLKIDPNQLFPSNKKPIVSAREAICDLENVDCKSDIPYENVLYTSKYIELMREKIY